MDSRYAFGLGLALAVIGTGLAVVPPLVDPPPATASALREATSCEDFRDRMVRANLDDVGPYGWTYDDAVPLTAEGAVGGRMQTSDSATSAPSLSSQTGQSSSETGTTVQEAGVDEPDIVKTDGRELVRIGGGRVVVEDVTGATPRRLGSWTLPRDTFAQELLLVGSRVVVVASQEPVFRGNDTGDTVSRSLPPAAEITRVITLDISTPARPRVLADQGYRARLLSLRQYGDVVRLVTATGRPELDWQQPRTGSRASTRQATTANRALLRETTPGQWLPSVADHLAGTSRPLVDCTDVALPSQAGASLISVVAFDPTTQRTGTPRAVATQGEIVYSSADHLYVAQQRSRSPRGGWLRRPGPMRTDLHSFALDGLESTYAGSATLDGWVRDRWSLDATGDTLRVAVGWQGRAGTTRDNGIVTLRQGATSLTEIGRVRGLGRGEDIQSARFFDDLAVLVTFRQVDPLYTVDLRDPARPRVLGELKIPGFSSYLHPIGGDRLIGIGTDADGRGQVRGAQASLFSLRDLAAPRRTGQVDLGRDSWALASEDPRAFTWLDSGVALTAVADAQGEQSWRVLGVSGERLVERKSVRSDATRALPLPDGRVALVGEAVRLVDVG